MIESKESQYKDYKDHKDSNKDFEDLKIEEPILISNNECNINLIF